MKVSFMPRITRLPQERKRWQTERPTDNATHMECDMQKDHEGKIEGEGKEN